MAERMTSNSPEFKEFIVEKHRNSIWNNKQPRFTKKDMSLSIKTFCMECNGETRWSEDNDCVSAGCPLFPYRPGVQNPILEKHGGRFCRASVGRGRSEMMKKRAASLRSGRD